MIQVVAGIILRGDSVLLCQRKASSRYGLKWEFPGGKVEKGEEPDAALRRELREELGIDFAAGLLFHHGHHTYDDGVTYSVFYYMISKWERNPTNKVFETIEWVSIARLHEFSILDGNSEVVRLLQHSNATSTAR